MLARRHGVPAEVVSQPVEQPLRVGPPRLLVHGALRQPQLLGVPASRGAGPARAHLREAEWELAVQAGRVTTSSAVSAAQADKAA